VVVGDEGLEILAQRSRGSQVNGVERAQAVLAETPGAFTAIARSREQRLLACEAAALDGTRLANCVKLKVPLEAGF